MIATLEDVPVGEEFDLGDLLWLISEMPLAVSSLAELLADCRLREIPADIDDLARLECAAQDAGLVDIWEDPDTGTGYLTLTPLAAEGLEVRLGRDSLRWWPRAAREGAEHVAHAEGEVDLPDCENLLGRYLPGDEHRPGHRDRLDRSIYIDPTQPEPIDVLIDLERRGEPLRNGHSVVVRSVLGLGLQWPQALATATVLIPGDGFIITREVCRGCGSRRQARNSYCAICHRCGVDGLLLPIERELQQSPQKTYRPGKLKGGTGTGSKVSSNGRHEIPPRTAQRQAQAAR